MSFTEIFANDLRIKASELSKSLDNYKIIDVRSSKEYLLGHIDGALHFPIDWTYENKSLNGKLTNPTDMKRIIRNLGLDTFSKVVIYDDGTFYDASRLFWALEVYGFENVKLLDYGYSRWVENEYKISTKPTIVKKSEYIVKINNKRLATKLATQIAVKNPNQVIVDARGTSGYEGETSSAKRYGHIPNAIHIPATMNLTSTLDGTEIKNKDELNRLYGSISKNKKVILYCAIGRIATTSYFGLRELGYDVSNYDASWREWGNDTNLAIVNPSKK